MTAFFCVCMYFANEKPYKIIQIIITLSAQLDTISDGGHIYNSLWNDR